GPGTRCESGQNGHTNRVPCAFGIFSTITAQPARHNRYIVWGAGTSFEAVFLASFVTGFAARRVTRFRARVARRCERREVRVAVIRWLSISRRAGFILLLFLVLMFLTPKLDYGLRRSTIMRSLFLFFRV